MNRILNGRKYKTKLKSFSGRPDLTPLLDVMFLVLIFLMIGNSFIKMYGVKVELPKTGPAKNFSVENYIVSIAQNQKGLEIYFRDEKLDINLLAQRLAKVSSESHTATIVICASGSVPFEIVAKVMTMAERANLNSFIAVAPDDNKKEAIFEK